MSGYIKLFKAIYQHQLNENSERDLICTLLPQIIYQRQSHHEFQRDLISTVSDHISPPRTSQRRKRCRTPSSNSPSRGRRPRIDLDLPPPAQSLIDDYNKRKAATARFPPKITPQHIRTAMHRYEQVIEDACAGVEASCASCGEFVAKTESRLIAVDDNRLHITKSPEGVVQLDHCGITDGCYRFCIPCFNALTRGRIPKFSAQNAVNVTMCQHYPADLEDLTLTEQYAIARSHPIGTILKLKPNGVSNSTAYNGVRGHIVTIPQNPGPLLNILPSRDLQFHDSIRIIWSGKTDPTADDLKPFVEVRKAKVIRALVWLHEHNPLYSSIEINYDLLNKWDDTFIPSVLQEAVVNLPEEAGDSDERGTYAGDMEGFAENDLHNALDDMADGTIASGAVYSDVEGQRQNPELKMVMALMEMLHKPGECIPDADSQEPVEVPVITWTSDGRRALMNDYEDAEYFTGAFPTLFPYGRGGHMPEHGERSIEVSLEAWAKSLLSHHSRRFARHPTFMYLLYDVIQRRKAALGNSLLVKRGDYEAVQEVISSLTYRQLITAAESLRKTQSTPDPAIAILRRSIQTVAARVPDSFAQKQEMRHRIRALFIEFGPAAFWLTINPSDLRDPLVVKLAGITLPNNDFQRTNAAFRRKAATMNLAAIATFFHKICTGILEALVSPGEGKIGIFGEVSTYFGVVETNGRGMLHLHCLIWLAGNLDFFDLREKMVKEPGLATQMINYLDSIISECIDTYESDDSPDLTSLPSTQDFETDQAYVDALQRYGNTVASKRQIHSQNHNSTCFKYSKKGARECRFYFPRPLVDSSHIDELGIAHLHRDNGWVNPYNPCIAAVMGSNQDLSFLATKAKALALLYYITNYATKDEASTYQMVMTAAIIKKTLEQAEQASTLSEEERIVLEKGMQKFSLRVFNRMSHDKEVSGVQVASSLLQLPAYYTPQAELHRVNLHYLRRRLQAILQCSDDDEGRNEEQVVIQSRKNVHVSVFDDYRWRGSSLEDLCLYEYIKLIRKRPARNRTASDMDFHTDHPEHGEKTQVDATLGSVRRTVALVGQLSQYQHIEDSVPGGHPETLAMQNDLAAVFLALFVPWEYLPTLFDDVISICGDGCRTDCDQSSHTGLQACAIVWSRVKDTLPKHVQELARNVGLLRKSKDDVDIDMAERKAATSAMQVAFNPDLDDNETLDEPVCDNGSIDDDTLRLSFHTIIKRWIREDSTAAAGIHPLRQPWKTLPSLSIESFTPILINSVSDIRQDISNDTLKLWSDLIKGAKASNINSNSHEITSVSQDIGHHDGNNDDDDYDSTPDNEYAVLEPILTFAESTTGPDMANLSAHVGHNPSPLHLGDLISEALPLNTKQKRTVSMLFYHVLRLQGKQAVELDDQFILYVGGEGGTGKSWIIDAVRLGMKLLKRERELLVIAPTGNAARNVQGSTIHTGLNVAVRGRPNRGPSSRIRSLWTEKIMLVIDEVSMVSSKLMDSMDKQCKVVKNLSSNSTAVFGGLHIILVLGDFHQFPPVRAKALWQKQESNDEKRGQQLWHLFENVVILDEQMRQQHDTDYHQLLQRARNATITQSDVDVLNTRVVTELESRTDRINTCIVRTNKFRHIINRLQMERFAQAQGQKIFLFPARHTRWKKARGTRDLDVDKLLEVQDGSDVKGPGLLMYTKNMPTAVLSNISTPLGIVNGSQGRAVGVVPDADAKFYPIDRSHMLCTLPPKCVLFQQHDSTTNTIFPKMGSTAVPIFCSSGPVKIGNMSVTRHQVPVTPAWAVTDYKVQGGTYDAVTLDLHRQNVSSKDGSSHKRYCSVYVQLTRVRSLQDLSLLQRVTLADLNAKPDRLLLLEDQRLAELARSTEIAWEQIESSDEFRYGPVG